MAEMKKKRMRYQQYTSYSSHATARSNQRKDPNNKYNARFYFNPAMNFAKYPLLAPLFLIMLHMQAPKTRAQTVPTFELRNQPPLPASNSFTNSTTSFSSQTMHSTHAPFINSQFLSSCLSFHSSKAANETYAKNPELRQKDIQTAKKILTQISASKAVGCKIKMLCDKEKLKISFAHRKEFSHRAIAESNPVDRSIKVKTGIKNTLVNKQTFVQGGADYRNCLRS